jgi:hypothetical protein
LSVFPPSGCLHRARAGLKARAGKPHQATSIVPNGTKTLICLPGRGRSVPRCAFLNANRIFEAWATAERGIAQDRFEAPALRPIACLNRCPSNRRRPDRASRVPAERLGLSRAAWSGAFGAAFIQAMGKGDRIDDGSPAASVGGLEPPWANAVPARLGKGRISCRCPLCARAASP